MSAAIAARPEPGNKERERFLLDAEAFIRDFRGAAAFRYLRWLTGCGEPELANLIGKIYCDALPESSDGTESPFVSAARSLAHPFAYALTKKYAWTRAASVASDLETIDRGYFDKWFTTIYAGLKAPKRLTPRVVEGFDGFELAEPIGRTVRFGTLLKLFAAPLFIPWLLFRPPSAVRPRFLRAYRKALSFFAIYDGHFDRYPCRDFITFADESNHPSRWIAFKRRCPGKLIVIQNGAREIHPVHAFGMADVYLVFGEFARRTCADLRMRVSTIEVIGALCLNERYPLWKERDAAAEPVYDVLFIDQTVWPYNGIDRAAGDGLLKIAENLGEYKRRHPKCRVAFQMRPYAEGPEKRAVLAAARQRFPGGVEILENLGQGDSYVSIMKSRLILTFSSTLGIEAFFFGRGTRSLFVNYTGSPVHDFAPEPRFQLTDDRGDYGTFEKKLDETLRLEIDEIPASIRDHHAHFDGRVQERAAAAITKEQA